MFAYGGAPITQVNTKACTKALGRAGIENFRWHDLRHTFATWHRQAGTPTHELQRLGGWKTGSMVERYAHIAPEALQGAADRLDAFSGYLVATPPEPPASQDPATAEREDGGTRTDGDTEARRDRRRRATMDAFKAFGSVFLGPIWAVSQLRARKTSSSKARQNGQNRPQIRSVLSLFYCRLARFGYVTKDNGLGESPKPLILLVGPESLEHSTYGLRVP